MIDPIEPPGPAVVTVNAVVEHYAQLLALPPSVEQSLQNALITLNAEWDYDAANSAQSEHVITYEIYLLNAAADYLNKYGYNTGRRKPIRRGKRLGLSDDAALIEYTESGFPIRDYESNAAQIEAAARDYYK